MTTPVGSNTNSLYASSNIELDRRDIDERSDSTGLQEEEVSAPMAAAPIDSSALRKDLRTRIEGLKAHVGIEHVKAQELWLKEIMDGASGKRVEGVHRPSLASASDISSQDRNREVQSLDSDLTNIELKTLGRSISNWAIFGLIHHFSILGGSPNRNLDFGEVSGIIGRTRNNENPEAEALDQYIARCAEKFEWGYFQTTFQTMWIKASYWVLSGVMPIVIEKTFCNVLDKVRLKSREEGNFEFVSWKLVDHLEGFLKGYGSASADGAFVNPEELKTLCDELAPFLISEFLPKLTLCEDKFNQVPFLSFFSFLSRPIDSILNTLVHYAVRRSFPGLLKKGLDALEKIIGGKSDQINYRMANPILAFINGKLEDLLRQVKNPSPEPGAPPPAEVQKKLKPLVDEIMKRSKVPCMDVEIKEYLASIVSTSPMGPIRDHLQEVLDGDYRGEELRKKVQDLADHVSKEWNEDIGSRLLTLANVPPVEEKIREEIRGGVIKGVYSLMQYLQKEQAQEVILQKTLNLATSSLFSESQASPLPGNEIHGKFVSLLTVQELLFQEISSGLVDSIVDVTAAKWIYGNPDKQVNHHWNTHHAKITGYLDAGISDKIISITNALDVAKDELNDLQSSEFPAVLAKHLVFWEGLCSVLQAATTGKKAPQKSKDKIEASFNWLYGEVHAQAGKIADLKREWDSYLVRRDLKALYTRMYEELHKKMEDFNKAKIKTSAKGLTRVAFQLQELVSHVPTSEEESFDIASMANDVRVLIQKEIKLKDGAEIVFGAFEESAIKSQEELLNVCVNIVAQSKEMRYTVESVNKAFKKLKTTIQAKSAEYEDLAQESRQSLIEKTSELQAGHETCLEKIRNIRCDKIPASAREQWGIGSWVASAIHWVDPGKQIGDSKQALRDDLNRIVKTFTPLVIADPLDSSLAETQAGVQPATNPLPRKNLYTWGERLMFSSLRSYYQSQTR